MLETMSDAFEWCWTGIIIHNITAKDCLYYYHYSIGDIPAQVNAIHPPTIQPRREKMSRHREFKKQLRLEGPF
jgi:hypothetical protein